MMYDENGKKVLYLQILRALYGMIESALLWYKFYTEVLHKEGFKTTNIGQDDFAKFEKVKAGLYSTAVGICFNQMILPPMICLPMIKTK